MAIWGLMNLYYKAAFESSFTYPGDTDRVPTTCQAAWQAWVDKVGSALKKISDALKASWQVLAAPTIQVYGTLPQLVIVLKYPCSWVCNFMDCSMAGNSVCENLQVRMLEWITISFSRGSSWA